MDHPRPPDRRPAVGTRRRGGGVGRGRRSEREHPFRGNGGLRLASNFQAPLFQIRQDGGASRPSSQESRSSNPISDAASAPDSPRELDDVAAKSRRQRRRSDPRAVRNATADAHPPRAHDGIGSPHGGVANADIQAMLQRIQQLENLFVLEGGDEEVTRWDIDQVHEKIHQLETNRPSAPDAEAMMIGKRPSPAGKRERTSPPRLISTDSTGQSGPCGQLPLPQVRMDKTLEIGSLSLGPRETSTAVELESRSDGCHSPRSARSVGSVGSDRSAFREVERPDSASSLPDSASPRLSDHWLPPVVSTPTALQLKAESNRQSRRRKATRPAKST